MCVDLNCFFISQLPFFIYFSLYNVLNSDLSICLVEHGTRLVFALMYVSSILLVGICAKNIFIYVYMCGVFYFICFIYFIVYSYCEYDWLLDEWSAQRERSSLQFDGERESEMIKMINRIIVAFVLVSCDTRLLIVSYGNILLLLCVCSHRRLMIRSILDTHLNRIAAFR